MRPHDQPSGPPVLTAGPQLTGTKALCLVQPEKLRSEQA